jgi:hypothetical protein
MPLAMGIDPVPTIGCTRRSCAAKAGSGESASRSFMTKLARAGWVTLAIVLDKQGPAEETLASLRRPSSRVNVAHDLLVHACRAYPADSSIFSQSDHAPQIRRALVAPSAVA